MTVVLASDTLVGLLPVKWGVPDLGARFWGARCRDRIAPECRYNILDMNLLK